MLSWIDTHAYSFFSEALNIPEATAAVENNETSSRTCQLETSNNAKPKAEAVQEARRSNHQVHLASLMYLRHLKQAELAKQLLHRKGPAVQRDIRLRFLCSPARARSISITQMAAWIQLADFQEWHVKQMTEFSAYTQVTGSEASHNYG